MPGVLATINGVLAEHKVNVEAQLLGTRGEIGYVVTDIARASRGEMLDQLRALPETIRLRVLPSDLMSEINSSLSAVILDLRRHRQQVQDRQVAADHRSIGRPHPPVAHRCGVTGR